MLLGDRDSCAVAGGDPEPSGCPGRELTGTGGIDVLDPARAGVKNALGETRADAGGADEDPVGELGAGSDDAEACDPCLPEGVDREFALREALDEISASCRRLLAAYYIEGHSLREAARVVSLQYSSVAKTISRCLKKLRKYFA